MTINPNEFQTTALAWIGVSLIVGSALIAAVGNLWGKVQSLVAAHAENRTDIRNVNDQITSVAAALPGAGVTITTGAQTDGGDRP